SSDLLGMQPQLRHTPPSACASITLTRAPSSAALMAATYPPAPAPRMAMCGSAGIAGVSAEVGIERDRVCPGAPPERRLSLSSGWQETLRIGPPSSVRRFRWHPTDR